MLAEPVGLVIGVDTHADTHTAELVAVDSRPLVDSIAAPAEADVHARLIAPRPVPGYAVGRSEEPRVTAPA